MNIAEMNLEEIEARSAEILVESESATEERLAELKAESEELAVRKAELAEIEERMAEAKALEEREAQPEEIIESHEEETRKDNNMFGIETKEYRDAFMASLVGRETVEQRAILADNSAYGDGLSLPIALDSQIWDQVHSAHPILSDVNRINAGMPIKVTKMTPAAVTKKMDSATNSEQTFTSAEVTLVGADYHTYVTLSYAEAKMSQGAMEAFLVNEIAAAIGEALAKDVFARIIADATTAQKVTATTDLFADLKSALGKAKLANNAVIYAPADKYYNIIGSIAQGSPFNAATVLGREVKLDNAATGVIVVDPKLVVLDVVQDTMIESQRDAKEAAYVISGYMRAEACLRKTLAASYIA